MENPRTDWITVEATGREGTVYRFRLGSGAICALEEKLGLDVMALFEMLQQRKIRSAMVREYVKAAIVGPELTDDDAFRVMDNIGIMPTLNAMTDSILATFNIQREPGADAEPPKKNGEDMEARLLQEVGARAAGPEASSTAASLAS